MPMIRLQPQPTVNLDDTASAVEGAYTDASLVRFHDGAPETVGGWELAALDAVDGIARGMHAWADNDQATYAAIGTHKRLYAYSGGGVVDITPLEAIDVLSAPFSVSISSSIVQVSLATHGRVAGDLISVDQMTAFGGVSLAGVYSVASVVDANTFTIAAGQNATSSAAGGGAVIISRYIATGTTDGLYGSGYGTGTYGSGTYSSVSTQTVSPRTWTFDNFGEILIANPRAGAVYKWQPNVGSVADQLTQGDFSATSSWSLVGGSWTIAGGKLNRPNQTTTNSTVVQTIPLDAGSTYRMQIVVDSVSSGGGLVPIAGGVDVGVTISTSGTYVRTFEAAASSAAIGLRAIGSTTCVVDLMSVKLERRAQKLTAAPDQVGSVFVAPERILVTCASEEEGDGSFNPLLVRWADQESLTTWTTTDTNFAGEFPLAKGGRIIRGIASRGQNLIWTDNSLYRMRFLGDTVFVYGFDLLGSGCGLLGPNAVVEKDGSAFWASSSGQFFMFDGAAPRPIQSNVEKFFYGNLAPSQGDKVYAALVSQYTEVWWFYPHVEDGNEVSRYVIYNWSTGSWSCGTLSRSSWVDAGVLPNPMGVTTGGTVYWHERGATNDGNAMDAFIEAAPIDIGDGDVLMRVNRIVPDFAQLTGVVDITVTTKPWPQGAEATQGPYQVTSTTEKVDMRATGRQIGFRVATGAGSGTRWRLGAMRVDATPTGSRR